MTCWIPSEMMLPSDWFLTCIRTHSKAQFHSSSLSPPSFSLSLTRVHTTKAIKSTSNTWKGTINSQLPSAFRYCPFENAHSRGSIKTHVDCLKPGSRSRVGLCSGVVFYSFLQCFYSLCCPQWVYYCLYFAFIYKSVAFTYCLLRRGECFEIFIRKTTSPQY